MADVRIEFGELVRVMADVLVRLAFDEDRAHASATLFAEASRDGVASHGLNRFERFVATIRNGTVDVGARAECVAAHGGLERWNGHRGPGNLNAQASMHRAITLAQAHGLGAVALGNTNHWMRGGSYGWQAAEAGVIGICWTNTLPNLPPWGSSIPLLGNNPLVMAVPRRAGHVVLDMAMSQFSFGALASHRSRNEALPVAGGFDSSGALTRDAASIEASGRPLPIGFWKGSGLALLLDIMGVLLSGGLATHDIPADPERETGMSQVFIALDAAAVTPGDRQASTMDAVVDRIIDQLQHATSAAGEAVRYPGQRTLETRRRSLADGVPVNAAVWRVVQSLSLSS